MIRPSCSSKYYTFNGQRIAMRDETGLTYLHADQLGSTALTTNGSGATLDDHGYNAYGKDRRGSELRTAQRFTGQQGDATGLHYMNARYYDPQLGQFTTADARITAGCGQHCGNPRLSVHPRFYGVRFTGATPPVSST